MKNKHLQAFSMIELIFVIVILGIIAGIAIPKISQTRGDASFTAVKTDISSMLSSVQSEVFSKDLSKDQVTPELIFKVSGLSNSRWIISGNNIVLGKDGIVDSTNSCVTASFDKSTGVFSVVVSPSTGNSSQLCQKLAKEYTKPAEVELF